MNNWTQNTKRCGVQLPTNVSGSQFLWECLRVTVAQFADVFDHLKLSSTAAAFRNNYAEDVIAFEASRLKSDQAGDIASYAATWAQTQLSFASADCEQPLTDYLARPHTALALEHVPAVGQAKFTPQLPPGPDVDGLKYLADLIASWQQRYLLTESAAKALTWASERAQQSGGLHFAGERIAILGAAAEVAPTALFLAAGFDVLWLDLRPPPPDLLTQSQRGALTWAQQGADLLLNPGAVKQTIIDYAAGQPLHLGLYAYAPGESRELRLCGAMNAIVQALPSELIKSVSLLISPTTPMRLTPEDIAAAQARRDKRPFWQALLARLGRLGSGPLAQDGLVLARSIVPLQGAAYQAAQYISKRLMADAWFCNGLGQGAAPAGQVVSANVAPITSTRSLSHPLFQAGFIGAPLFGVHISSPAVTRLLAFLTTLYDLFEPSASARRPGGRPIVAADLQALAACQIHGGVAGLPYTLEPSITVAALVGLMQKPGLLASFWSK